jgi:hypothetical protein
LVAAVVHFLGARPYQGADTINGVRRIDPAEIIALSDDVIERDRAAPESMLDTCGGKAIFLSTPAPLRRFAVSVTD